MSNPLLDAALEYRSRGLCVIPIRAGTKKAALRSWKPYQSQRPDDAMLRGWFAAGDKAVAIVCGAVSGGLIVRDFDQQAAYDRWASEHADLASKLPTVATARGRHVYGRIADRRGIVTMADGELRGDGAYILAPPSIHPEGPAYRWIVPLNGELPIIDLHSAGFIPCNTVGAVDTGDTEDTEDSRQSPAPTAPSAPTCAPLRPTVLHGELIEFAIASTLPMQVGHRRKCLFDFARRLKAIPARADATPAELEPIIRQWHAAALPVIGTKPIDDTLLDFARAWKCVKYPAGAGPLADVFERAEKAPVPEAAMRFEQPALRLLVSACRELQRTAGTGTFFLACRTAAQYLNVDHSTAWRFLDGLCDFGILTKTSIGSRAARRANEYRYVGDESSADRSGTT